MTEQFKDSNFQSKKEESLEEKLKGRYMIEKIKEGEWAQCDSDECFEEAEWFVEGFMYCPKHKENTLRVLSEMDEKRRQEKETKKGSTYIRPKNLLGAFGLDTGRPGLTEEEGEMQKLLSEEYKTLGTSFFEEIREWRALHPDATLGDSIRAL